METPSLSSAESRIRFLFSIVAATIIFLYSTGTSRADYTVSGTFSYEDREFDISGFTGVLTNKPIREADVEVFDNDTSTVLASGATDANGQFSISVTETTTRNIMVRCLTSSGNTSDLFITVKNNDTDKAIYALNSSQYPSHNPSTDIDFTSTPVVADSPETSSGGAFNIFDNTLDAFDYVKLMSAARPTDPLITYWENGSTSGPVYYPGLVSVYIPGNVGSDDSSYDDTVILHEVGHYIHDKFSKQDPVYGSHSITGHYDIRLTFNEGLATYIASAVRLHQGVSNPDIYVETTGASGTGALMFSYENETPSYSTSTTGADNEVAVTAVLWDIIDGASTPDTDGSSDDDSIDISDGETKIWAILTEYIPTIDTVSIEDFWDGWFSKNYGMSSEMTANFQGRSIEYFSDSIEGNDTFSTATAISSFGTNTHATHYPAGDFDWFKLSAEADAAYGIDTYLLTNGSNTVLELYDSDGTTLISSSDDRSTSDSGSSIAFAPASAGTYYIKAYRKTGASEAGTYGSYDFEVDRMKVSSVLAATGHADKTNYITISGDNFQNNSLQVTSNGASAFEIIYHDASTISAKIPPGQPGAASISVSEIINTTTNTVISKALTDGFTYTGQGVSPVITGITPSYGISSGNPVVISGLNFSSGATVTFGSTSATATVTNSGSISAIPPVHASGASDITVTNSDGKSSTISGVFECVPSYVNDESPDIATIDSGTITSTIDVTDTFVLTDIMINTDITHEYKSDLKVSLTSPSGTIVYLHNLGGGSDDDVTGTFGDDLVPAQFLSGFIGENVQGTWTLTVEDTKGGDQGSLNDWQLFLFQSRDGASSSAPKLWVANSYDYDISVIDSGKAKTIAKIAVQDFPDALNYTIDQTKMYVANYASNSVSVIDTSTGAVTNTISVGTNPFNVVPRPGTNEVWIANLSSSNISIIDDATETVSATLSTGQGPRGITFSADGNTAYITEHDTDNVIVVDASNKTVSATITGFNQPHDIAAVPGSNNIMVVDNKEVTVDDSEIHFIDSSTNTITKSYGTTDAGGGYRIDMASDGSKALVTYFSFDDRVAYIDLSTDNMTMLSGTSAPANPAFDSTHAYGFVTSWYADVVNLYELSSGTILYAFPVGMGPKGIQSSSGTVSLPPDITGLSSYSGTTQGGNEITIYGSKFMPSASVSIGGTNATATFINSTRLQITVPSGSAGSVDIVVSNPGGISDTLFAGYTYLSGVEATPSLTTASQDDSTFTLTGTNFQQNATVTINGVSTNIISISSSSIEVSASIPTSGSKLFVVINPDGLSTGLESNALAVDIPTLSEWGSIFFIIILLLSGSYLMTQKRKRITW